MLQNLHVKNLALIDEIEVDFSEGLNILTGETGAGKSIVLGSINLALGGKYSADMLRRGADFGLVELTFHITNEDLIKKLHEMDIFPEDNQIIISRKLMEGRSVSRINGETVTLSKLKSVAEELIDIHGQHEHQSLLYKKNHLTILDAFSKDARNKKEQVKQVYQKYREISKALEEASTDESDRIKEIAFLEFEINEIESANLSVEEAQEVEDTYRRMLAGKRIVENLEEAYTLVSSESEANAADLIGRAIRSLADVSEQDEKADELYGQLLEVESLLSDFTHELRSYTDSMSFSPEAFYETETRLNEINHLKVKYGNSVEEILHQYEEKEERLQILKNYDVYLRDLRSKQRDAEMILKKECESLTKIRKEAALQMQKEITNGLQDLNFLDVVFEIHFEETRGYTADGTDDVEYLISMNPGEPVKPLGNVASGGELSRIMLAIKSVLADKDEIDTLIFDEIDVGISGRTAQKVSEKMALIGSKHQVICITHLPQIAAMADTHFAIVKKTCDQITRTEIFRLGEEESVSELARILGGVEITDAVMKNAMEMRKLAKGLKS